MAHVDFGLDGGEFLLGSRQLCVGLAQSLPLGLHLAVDLVEAHDVDDPRAEAGGGVRLGRHELGLELGVLQVGLDGLQAAFRNVLLVEVDERVQESVHLGHHHLGGLPAAVLGDTSARRHKDHDSGRHVGNGDHWRAEGLQLC